MSGLLPNVVEGASDVAYSFGYLGIAFLVMLGNLHLPVPTELTLPLAGFLVGQGRFSFFPALVWTTVAAVASSLVLYFPGVGSARSVCDGSLGGSAGSCSCASRTWTRRKNCSISTAGKPS